jgi:hypothetical protein
MCHSQRHTGLTAAQEEDGQSEGGGATVSTEELQQTTTPVLIEVPANLQDLELLMDDMIAEVAGIYTYSFAIGGAVAAAAAEVAAAGGSRSLGTTDS